MDGERAVSAEPALTEGGTAAEPVYGDVYLPRKFKIGVAWPGDNCIDVFSNDVALVPTLAEPGDRRWRRPAVTGTWCHRRRHGHGPGPGGRHLPRWRIATGMGAPDRVVDTVEAVVTTQRDHGNRDDRNRARLKYLVDERGSSGCAPRSSAAWARRSATR